MGDKSTVQELRDAALRWKSKAQQIQAGAEEMAGEFIATCAVGASSAAGGFLDELKGQDVGYGIRQHKIGNIPTTAGAGALLEGAAAFGVFGKYSRVGYALGQGAIGAFTNTWGRMLGAGVREKSAKTSVTMETTTAVAVKKTGTEG